MTCNICGKEIKIDGFGRVCCGCNTLTVSSLTGSITVHNEDIMKNGVVQNAPKYKTGVSCLLCGKFVEAHNPLICRDCKALWEKIKEERSTARSANNE